MEKANPRVSIVIPCYNHGEYIPETIASIEQIEDKNLYEVIIVNDGSTDQTTNDYLKNLQQENKDNYTIIFQENQGVCFARNKAISLSRGTYILPLDADNILYPEYIYRSVDIMDNSKDISVVYSNVQLIGEETGTKIQRDFNLQSLMLDNYIDTCAVFKRSLWEDVGGYDPNMRTGLEDWEFWLHAAFKGYKFYHIDEVLFEYRVVANSRTNKLISTKVNANNLLDYMSAKHTKYFSPTAIDENLLAKFKSNPMVFITKLFLKAYFPNKFLSLANKGKFRKFF